MVTFVALARAKSVSAAATLCGTQKSTVSRQLERLEEVQGARLVQRSARGVALTEAGGVFLAACERVVAAADEAIAAVTLLANRPRGHLRLAAPVLFGEALLPPVITAFAREYDGITVSLELTNRAVRLVEEHIDVAIQLGAPTDAALIARRLRTLEPVCCASPSYLDRHGTPATIDDLAAHECLVWSTRQTTGAWRFAGADGPVSIAVRGRIASESAAVHKAAALAGMAIALLPSFLVRSEFERGELRELFPYQVIPAGAIHVVYPSAQHLAPKVRAFVDFLVERLGDRSI